MRNLARKVVLILMTAGAITVVRAETSKPDATTGAAQDARCVPHFDGGLIDGYRCLQIRPGSRYDKVFGLRDGDVIRRIDGASLEDPLTALEKLSRLSAPAPGKVSLVLSRGGHEITSTIDPDESKAPRSPKERKQVNR